MEMTTKVTTKNRSSNMFLSWEPSAVTSARLAVLFCFIFILQQVNCQRCFSDIDEDSLCHPSDTIQTYITKISCCALSGAVAHSTTNKPLPNSYFPCTKCEKPVDGSWSQWTQFSACTVTCGTGRKQRVRHCDNPPPSHGGKNCMGEWIQNARCADNPCTTSTIASMSPDVVLTPSWGDWFDTPCSVTCGYGIQKTVRKCYIGGTPVDDSKCVGDSSIMKPCGSKDCDSNIVNDRVAGSQARRDNNDGDEGITLYIVLGAVAGAIVVMVLGIVVFVKRKQLCYKTSYENHEAIFTYRKMSGNSQSNSVHTQEGADSLIFHQPSCSEDYETPRSLLDEDKQNVYEEF